MWPNLTALSEANNPKSTRKNRKGATKKSEREVYRSVVSDSDELA